MTEEIAVGRSLFKVTYNVKDNYIPNFVIEEFIIEEVKEKIVYATDTAGFCDSLLFSNINRFLDGNLSELESRRRKRFYFSSLSLAEEFIQSHWSFKKNLVSELLEDKKAFLKEVETSTKKFLEKCVKYPLNKKSKLFEAISDLDGKLQRREILYTDEYYLSSDQVIGVLEIKYVNTLFLNEFGLILSAIDIVDETNERSSLNTPFSQYETNEYEIEADIFEFSPFKEHPDDSSSVHMNNQWESFYRRAFESAFSLYVPFDKITPSSLESIIYPVQQKFIEDLQAMIGFISLNLSYLENPFSLNFVEFKLR